MQFEDISSELAILLEGIGCLQEIYHIQIENTVEPLVHLPRPFQIALRKELIEALEGMEFN